MFALRAWSVSLWNYPAALSFSLCPESKGVMMMELDRTVIPSVRELKYLETACRSDSPMVLISNANISDLERQVAYVHQSGKQAFAHLGLIGGFAPDAVGIRLLRNKYRLDGIFTTDCQAFGMARKVGMKVIYRCFLIDSRSLARTNAILRGKGEKELYAMEVLPAVCALELFSELKALYPEQRLLAGGFIRDGSLIQQLFQVGFSGVTTSAPALWKGVNHDGDVCDGNR